MRTTMRFVAAAAMAILGLAACMGQDKTGVPPAASSAPSTGSAEPAARDQPSTSSVSEKRSVGRTSPQAPRPAASRGSLPADAGAKTSSLHQGFPVLLGVRVGNHPGYTRYVFDFTNADPDGHSPLGSARPGWDVRYVPPAEAVQDGSGDPPPVGGAVYLRIRFDGAAAHYDDGTPSIRYGLDAHSPLGFGGDFEGHVTWFLGLERQQPFNLSFVENSKVVLDLASAQ